MATKNVLLPIPLTSVAGSAFGASYQAINTSGLPKGVCILRIVNNSNADLTISYDGSTDHDFVPATTQLIINAQTNAQPNTSIANFSVGTRVFVKGGSNMSTGGVYLTAYYQPNV